MQTRTALGFVLVVTATAALWADFKSPVAENAAYNKMKTLVGSWEGTAFEDGKKIPTNARFRLVADGSALAGWLNEGTADEMVTMFHLDGDELLATHYCAAHNQPRMTLVPSGDPNRLVFKFKDGTNIKPGAGYMHQVAIVLLDPDHHSEEWTFLMDGNEHVAKFDFRRKS